MRVVLCFLLCAGSARAADMPHHPFRQIGTNVYSVQPLYDWWKKVNVPSSKIPKVFPQRPLTNWIGVPMMLGTNGIMPMPTYTVRQVVPGAGLIIEPDIWSPGRGRVAGLSFLLVNYPGWEKFTDGETIKFLALRVGVFRFEGETLAKYDYGIVR